MKHHETDEIAGVHMVGPRGIISPEGMDPTLFFLVDLRPTIFGMAAFSVLTAGSVLRVLLVLVRLVSRFDDRRPE